jgi:hypothetical protein
MLIFFRKHKQLSVLLAALMLLVSSGFYIHMHACNMDGSKSISVYKYNIQSSCTSCCNKIINNIVIKENCCKETIISAFFKANAAYTNFFYSFKNYENLVIISLLVYIAILPYFSSKSFRFQHSSIYLTPLPKGNLAFLCKLNI